MKFGFLGTLLGWVATWLAGVFVYVLGLAAAGFMVGFTWIFLKIGFHLAHVLFRAALGWVS